MAHCIIRLVETNLACFPPLSKKKKWFTKLYPPSFLVSGTELAALRQQAWSSQHVSFHLKANV